MSRWSLEDFRPGLRCLAAAWLALGVVAWSGPATAIEDVLQAVVGLRADIPPEARTAPLLGVERHGSGVVIDDQGLVLTIGYLVIEASGAILTAADGREVPAAIVAYDHETGFGLVRATRPLGVTPMRLGKSDALEPRSQVLVASRAGPRPVIAAQVVSRRQFVGYWEYMLEDAIFTAPPHPFHSGAALVGDDGRLLGIGSLFVANAIAENAQMPGNMFVPVDELKPILADLLERGRRSGAVRPWLGLTTNELFGRVIVARVTEDGPAARAGMKQGDIILGVGGAAIAGQADFYKKIWGIGSAGAPVPLAVLPAGAMVFEATTYNVKSIDRYDWLKIDKGL